MKRILIVIDMQNDFVTGALGSDAAQAVVEPVRRKVEAYREQGLPVLFTMDTHQAADYEGQPTSQEAEKIPRHCVEGEEGWRIVPQLRPYAEDNALTKPSFLSTSLADVVRGKYGGDVAFELCGVCTDICVVSNALSLRGEFPASPIVVDAACCAGTTQANHDAALAVMASCLVEVV